MSKESSGLWYPVTEDAAMFPGVTNRVRAAIELRVPDSGIDWLDAMIVRSRREWLAALATDKDVAMYTKGVTGLGLCAAVSRLEARYKFADAMLAESQHVAEGAQP